MIVAYRAEFAMPKRTSLPSMFPPGWVADASTSTPRAAWMGLPFASAQYAVVAPPMKRMYIAAHKAQPCACFFTIRPKVQVSPAEITKIPIS